MAPNKHSRDAIYVEFGKFKAGATGPIAVPIFALLMAGAVIAKLLGLW